MTVLYELHYQLPLMLCIVFGVIILALISFGFIYLRDRKTGDEFGSLYSGRSCRIRLTVKEEKSTLICMTIVVFSIMIGSSLILGLQYSFVKKQYEKGDFKEVCGYVEDFVPVTANSKTKFDTFEIDGIEFIIDDKTGYATPHREGGVITGDGQRLHIKYVTAEASSNTVRRHIVYIAEVGEDVKVDIDATKKESGITSGISVEEVRLARRTFTVIVAMLGIIFVTIIVLVWSRRGISKRRKLM